MPTRLQAAISQNSKFQISPNPASEMINLSFNEIPSPDQRIFILDIQGNLIREIKTSGGQQLQIEVSDLNTGIYFVKVEDGQSFKAVSGKFVIH